MMAQGYRSTEGELLAYYYLAPAWPLALLAHYLREKWSDAHTGRHSISLAWTVSQQSRIKAWLKFK